MADVKQKHVHEGKELRVLSISTEALSAYHKPGSKQFYFLVRGMLLAN